MGHRANLAIGNASSYQLYYSHWCATTLPRDLFWGPDHAIAFASRQRAVDVDNGWLDSIWAEGGAVIDWQNKTFLLYGGMDLLYDVPLRRLFLKMLNTAWPGWTTRWAFEGIVGIAEYLGVPRERTIADTDDIDKRTEQLTPPQDREGLRSIGTIRSEGGLAIYPLGGDPLDYLLAGPQLIVSSKSIPSFASLNTSEWTNDFPTGGFHLDLNKRQLDFWTADSCPNGLARVAKAWSEWRVSWQQDRFESHVEFTDAALKLNHRPQSELVSDLLKMLDQDSKPVKVAELVQRSNDLQGGSNVEVNPFAMQDTRLSVDPAHRKAILARCIAALNAG